MRHRQIRITCRLQGMVVTSGHVAVGREISYENSSVSYDRCSVSLGAKQLIRSSRTRFCRLKFVGNVYINSLRGGLRSRSYV